jgi:hypothetical protein
VSSQGQFQGQFLRQLSARSRQRYSSLTSLSDFDRADIHKLKLDWQWDDGYGISDAALWSGARRRIRAVSLRLHESTDFGIEAA